MLRSRNTVRDAQIVVTNHALLLSALSIGDSDNGQPMIAAPSDMLLVLDEGHHVGNVAIDQGAASLALDEMAKRTGRLQILIAGAYRAVDKDRLGNLLPNEAIDAASNVAKGLRAFRDHVEAVWMPAPADEEPMWRAANGRLPEAWREPIEALADDTRSLYNWAQAANAQVAKGKPEDAARERLQQPGHRTEVAFGGGHQRIEAFDHLAEFVVDSGAYPRRPLQGRNPHHRAIRRGRFAIGDVEAGAGDLAGIKGLFQRHFVDEAAASGVDQQGFAFHQGEFARTDHAARFRGQRAVEGDDVGSFHDLVEGGLVGLGGRVDAHRKERGRHAAGKDEGEHPGGRGARRRRHIPGWRSSPAPEPPSRGHRRAVGRRCGPAPGPARAIRAAAVGP